MMVVVVLALHSRLPEPRAVLEEQVVEGEKFPHEGFPVEGV
jgi:hypothetical protein